MTMQAAFTARLDKRYGHGVGLEAGIKRKRKRTKQSTTNDASVGACKCGSLVHKGTSSKDCRLYKKNDARSTSVASIAVTYPSMVCGSLLPSPEICQTCDSPSPTIDESQYMYRGMQENDMVMLEMQDDDGYISCGSHSMNNNDSQFMFCDGDHNDDDDSRCSTADETESVTNIRFGFLNILLDGSYESDSSIATNCGTNDCNKGMVFK